MTDDRLAALKRLHAATTPGEWKLTLSKNGRWQISNGLVQIAQVWTTIAHPAAIVGGCIVALHNDFPALIERLEKTEKALVDAVKVMENAATCDASKLCPRCVTMLDTAIAAAKKGGA